MKRHYVDGFLDALEFLQREIKDCKSVEEVQEVIARLIMLAKEHRFNEISRELGYFRINTR